MDPLESLSACLNSLPNQPNHSQSDSVDVYAELEQNHNDLILAGELGKALLEKTNHLSEENEKLSQEFTRDNERLRQENHELRLRLEGAEEALESAASEHENEVATLARQLAERQHLAAACERERSDAVEQLLQQNERLSAEVQAARSKEDLLQTEVVQLRAELRQRRSVAEGFSVQAELLQDENKSMRRQCDRLECELRDSVAEREELSQSYSSLEFTAASFEKKNALLEQQLQSTTCRFREYQERMEGARDKVQLVRSPSSFDCGSPVANHSLLEEIEISQKSLTSGYASNASLLDEFESDDVTAKSPTSANTLNGLPPLDAYSQLRLEVSEALEIMKGAASEVSAFLGTSPGSEEQPKAFKTGVFAGELVLLANQIKGHMVDVVRGRQAKRLSYDSMEKKSLQQTQKIEELREAVRALEAEKAALLQTRSSHGGREQASELERERDEAAERCDTAVAELLRAKNHLMNLENELLETIQKKIRLSQQVEQWQVDMEQMVSATVKSQLLREVQAKAAASAAAAGASTKKSTNRFFSRR